MDEPIVDADIVPSSEEQVPDVAKQTPVAEEAPASTVTADTVLELEQMIKTNVTSIDRNKLELKKLKEMLESALLNDEPYREATQKVKEAAKEKGKAKATVMMNQATKQLAEKVKDLTQENKELAQAQSEYLSEYARLSGTNEIETEDGEMREIIYIAKLIKKAMAGKGR